MPGMTILPADAILPPDARAELARFALTVFSALGAWVLVQAKAWLKAHADDRKVQTAQAILDSAAAAGRAVAASTYADKAKAADTLDPARAQQIALDAGKTMIAGEALKIVSAHFGPQWASALATAIEQSHAGKADAPDADALARSLVGMMSAQADHVIPAAAPVAPGGVLAPIPDHTT